MADTQGSFITRRRRREARRHAEIVADRLRRLGPPMEPEPVTAPVAAVEVTTHTQRWCPETDLNILLGPDLICPACGADTVLR